jgi:hypothetical protein
MRAAGSKSAPPCCVAVEFHPSPQRRRQGLRRMRAANDHETLRPPQGCPNDILGRPHARTHSSETTEIIDGMAGPRSRGTRGNRNRAGSPINASSRLSSARLTLSVCVHDRDASVAASPHWRGGRASIVLRLGYRRRAGPWVALAFWVPDTAGAVLLIARRGLVEAWGDCEFCPRCYTAGRPYVGVALAMLFAAMVVAFWLWDKGAGPTERHHEDVVS